MSVEELNVRNTAWLAFLTYIYDGTMKESSWLNDNRMGIKFIDAMNDLSDMDLVRKEGEYWKSTDLSKDYIETVFPDYPNRNAAEKAGKDFEQYDTPTYTISRLPYDIYDKVHSVKRDVDRKFDMDVYTKINRWLSKYQRDQGLGINNSLVKYAGAEGDLFRTADEYFYRGVVLNRDAWSGLKVGDEFEDNRISWTTLESIAKSFAVGNTNWMDNKKLSADQIGVVLKHKFSTDEIFMDLNWVDMTHPEISVDFPDEHEIIVVPKKRKVEVYKIIYPD